MEIHTVKAQTRHTAGKGSSRTLRREGRVPAILYGSDIENVSLSVSIYEVEHLFKKVSYSQALLNLVVENGQSFEKMAMIKEIQTDPVSRQYLHIDFYEVKMDQKITATVPVVLKGTAKGIINGGIVQNIRRELEVVCFPADIPKNIEIDISDLDIGDAIHVEDIKLVGDIEIPYDVNFAIVTVVSSKMIEEKVAVEGEEAEGEEVEAAAKEEE